jgi:TrmH family RNA methyltransferase
LCGVADPGNAGTVIRTADAVGADAVALTAGSADPYAGKAVRASAGSLFHLPVLVDVETNAIDDLRRAGVQVFAAEAGGTSLDDIPAAELAHPTVWLFGNEAHGLDAALRPLTDRSVGIPIYGSAESLNLAAAAAVCLYASARAQRAAAGSPAP